MVDHNKLNITESDKLYRTKLQDDPAPEGNEIVASDENLPVVNLTALIQRAEKADDPLPDWFKNALSEMAMGSPTLDQKEMARYMEIVGHIQESYALKGGNHFKYNETLFSPKVVEALKVFDLDQDGTIDSTELLAAAEAKKAQEKQISFQQKLLRWGCVGTVLVCALMFGMSYWAAETSKEVRISNGSMGALRTNDGQSVATATELLQSSANAVHLMSIAELALIDRFQYADDEDEKLYTAKVTRASLGIDLEQEVQEGSTELPLVATLYFQGGKMEYRESGETLVLDAPGGVGEGRRRRLHDIPEWMRDIGACEKEYLNFPGGLQDDTTQKEWSSVMEIFGLQAGFEMCDTITQQMAFIGTL